MLNDDGLLIWVTGLAGSGKTTLGLELEKALNTRGRKVIFLDGDSLREATDGVFGFTREERLKCALFYSRLCTLLVSQGHLVICCTISMFDMVRDQNRKMNRNYFEIYIKASDELLQQRNKKSLYSSGAQAVVGKDIAIEEPKHPDVILSGAEDLKTAAPALAKDIERKFWRGANEVQHQG